MPKTFRSLKAANCSSAMAHEERVRSGVSVHGAFEGDDPEIWDTQTLGEEPEVRGKGDRSHEPNAAGSRRAL